MPLSLTPSLNPPPSKLRSAREAERAKEIARLFSILHQWGIDTLGQLAALSREDLVVRLGAVAGELWDRASGKRRRLLKFVSPPEKFIESFEFDHEIETAEPLLFMLRRFLQQLGQRLNAIYLVARDLRLRLLFSDKTQYERLFQIPQPTNNEETLFRMLYAHLENFNAPHPIVAMELEAKPIRSVSQQFGLFETALRDPAQLHETLACLVGLLGANRVGTPQPEATHRPDAFRMNPFAWEFPAPRESPQTPPETRKSKPALRRFRKRKAATVLLEENQPVHVRADDNTSGFAQGRNGPFPLSGHWWDEHAWARVEWDLALEGGTIIRCHEETAGWAVDGIYD